ncbi:hypothetical protein Pelo_11568 [Pelomyxa schiedti]|nr:hypothetical protein Pelo_11568 [Pelomyxa schiedti]
MEPSFFVTCVELAAGHHGKHSRSRTPPPLCFPSLESVAVQLPYVTTRRPEEELETIQPPAIVPEVEFEVQNEAAHAALQTEAQINCPVSPGEKRTQSHISQHSPARSRPYRKRGSPSQETPVQPTQTYPTGSQFYFPGCYGAPPSWPTFAQPPPPPQLQFPGYYTPPCCHQHQHQQQYPPPPQPQQCTCHHQPNPTPNTPPLPPLPSDPGLRELLLQCYQNGYQKGLEEATRKSNPPSPSRSQHHPQSPNSRRH